MSVKAKSARKPAKKVAKKVGRPSDYTTKAAALICSRIAEKMSLRAACEGIISANTACRWLVQFPEFREQYLRAREARADQRFESLDDVIADMRAGKIDAVMARVEMDAIKWQTSKELPSRYSDKASVELTGPAGGPIQTTHRIEFVAPPK